MEQLATNTSSAKNQAWGLRQSKPSTLTGSPTGPEFMASQSQAPKVLLGDHMCQTASAQPYQGRAVGKATCRGTKDSLKGPAPRWADFLSQKGRAGQGKAAPPASPPPSSEQGILPSVRLSQGAEEELQAAPTFPFFPLPCFRDA